MRTANQKVASFLTSRELLLLVANLVVGGVGAGLARFGGHLARGGSRERCDGLVEAKAVGELVAKLVAREIQRALLLECRCSRGLLLGFEGLARTARTAEVLEDEGRDGPLTSEARERGRVLVLQVGLRGHAEDRSARVRR